MLLLDGELALAEPKKMFATFASCWRSRGLLLLAKPESVWTRRLVSVAVTWSSWPVSARVPARVPVSVGVAPRTVALSTFTPTTTVELASASIGAPVDSQDRYPPFTATKVEELRTDRP